MAPASLLIAAGENSVLQQLVRQLDGRAGLISFATANTLLWHARRTPPQMVVASSTLPDISGADLIDILPILCPGVQILLCGVDDPQLARALKGLGGDFVALTNTPAQNLRQLYQALNIEQPATVEAPAAQAAYAEPRWNGSGMLSSHQMSLMQQLLQQLLSDTAADCLLFSDTVGMPLLRLGQIEGLRTDIVGPLLAPALYASVEFARQFADQSPQALYLYEGARYNIYALNVDQRYLVMLVIDTTRQNGAPAPVWALAKRAIRRMQKILKK